MKNNASSEAYPMKRKSWTDEMEDEFRELLKKKDAVCFITFADDRAVAFAQCLLRYDYVEGTETKASKTPLRRSFLAVKQGKVC